MEDPLDIFPESDIKPAGMMSNEFLKMNISTFHTACAYVHRMPYGYNTDRDDLMSLFKEGKGTCTTKHAVIATLAVELGLPVHKHIGIYGMTEELVSGAHAILEKYALPYLPMVHCYLVYESHRVDLTEGNANGKNRSIENFLFTAKVDPHIPAKKEYLLYRNVLQKHILMRNELDGVPIKTVLQAREEGLALLKAKVDSWLHQKAGKNDDDRGL
jgi:hypothetical protein